MAPLTVCRPSQAIQHVQAQSVERASAHYFAFAGASWLITLSLPLLFFPRFLALLLGPPLTEDDQSGPSLRTLNGLETYLAVRCLTSPPSASILDSLGYMRQQLTGLSFVAVALILVLQTGAVPLTSSLATAPGAAHGPETAVAQAAPFRTPTCAIATLFFATLGLASWQVGMRFIAFSSGSLAAFGVYVTLFGNEVRDLLFFPW